MARNTPTLNADGTLDGVQMAIINKRMEAICAKMANTLLRTGRSGVLNSARDFSCCIVTAENRLLTVNESLPIHVLRGADMMCESMQEFHADLKRGDAYLHNSPYHGCSHPADHTILAPVIDDEGVHRFTMVAKAHQADCGNSIATTYHGSARDVYEEGALIFPAVQIQRDYEDIEDIVRMCRLRIRVPEQWWGDYLAELGAARIGEVDFDDGWELLRNTVKPYAACLLTHPVIDAARALAPEAAGREARRIELRVNPAAIRLAGKADPQTPLEGKFSLAFCTALGLAGRAAVEGDFTAGTLADPDLRSVLARVEPVAEPGRDTRSAALEIQWFDGAADRRETAMARGNPGNPLSRADLEAKFRSLAEPALGEAAEVLSALAWDFDAPGRARELLNLLAA